MSLKQWIKPELEVLQVNMTELDPKNGKHTDQTFPSGTDRDLLTWS
ncbi:hypothetical protein FHS15_001186 [Paenibacillus castaneae]|nr:paeninodin family lasso peptide [Paenibacillus castaneae]NIK76079.1 hypothetical protein [Paenibacillus castaneae]